jgi:hypothetical protein
MNTPARSQFFSPMVKVLLNSLTVRLLCATAVLLLVAGLFVGGLQPVAVGLLTAPWDKLAHATVFAVLTALLALALHGKPPHPGARWALRPGTALVVAALLAGAVGIADELHQATLPGRVPGLDDLLADAVGICVGLWVARGVLRTQSFHIRLFSTLQSRSKGKLNDDKY